MAKETIYVIDDDPSIRELFTEALGENYELQTFEDGLEGMEALEEQTPDLLILDLRLPGKGGLEIMDEISEEWPELQVIMVTAHQDVESAVKAMKLGAFDYVIKPFNLDEIEMLIDRALETRELKREVKDLRSHIGGEDSQSTLVGQAESMKSLKERIDKLANTNTNVLVRGESGTGKEVVANQLHLKSDRSDYPLMALNCAAVPDKLLESELFGYEKGAFTGAETDKKGKIELADQGTLFLDEIGAMPTDMQAKLLRVLESKRFIPVGAEDEVTVDFRLISATSADIESRIADDEFREDLFYRINVVTVEIPPLRDRKEDIPELCEYFLSEINRKVDRDIRGIGEKSLDLLMKHDWPGNVRELRNALESAAVVGESEVLKPEDFNLARVPGEENENGERIHAGMSIEDVEEILVRKTLQENDGNITKSADQLGITRKTLRNKKEKYGLEID